MFIAFAALDFLLIASGYYRKNLISYSLILTVLFLAPGVIRNNISEEYNVSKK